jgi:hypothetical protein
VLQWQNLPLSYSLTKDVPPRHNAVPATSHSMLTKGVSPRHKFFYTTSILAPHLQSSASRLHPRLTDSSVSHSHGLPCPPSSLRLKSSLLHIHNDRSHLCSHSSTLSWQSLQPLCLQCKQSDSVTSREIFAATMLPCIHPDDRMQHSQHKVPLVVSTSEATVPASNLDPDTTPPATEDPP